MTHSVVCYQWTGSYDYSYWTSTGKKQMTLNHVYVELLTPKPFQTLRLPERNCCCSGCTQICLLHLWRYPDGSHWSCSELRSHHSRIWWTTPWTANCFLAELLNDPFWQIFSHDLAQLKNCFFLLRLVFWMAPLPLLGNQFVSCGMDWSICHFDAFSHTKNFIHNFLRVPAP